MLFDEIFRKQSRNNDKSIWPASEKWTTEINKWLEFIKYKKELERYLPRLKDSSARRDDALSEIYSAYILETKFNYKIIGWEEKGNNGKDIDLVIKDGNDKVYCEVKSPGWESELNSNERKNGRSRLEKHVNGEVRGITPWRPIRYAVKKAYPKFLAGNKNVVIIKDDLFIEPDSGDFEMALYEPKPLFDNESGYFADAGYGVISGVLHLQLKLVSGQGFERTSNYYKNPFALNMWAFN